MPSFHFRGPTILQETEVREIMEEHNYDTIVTNIDESAMDVDEHNYYKTTEPVNVAAMDVYENNRTCDVEGTILNFVFKFSSYT